MTWGPANAAEVLIMELRDDQIPDGTQYVDLYDNTGNATVSTLMFAEESANKPAALKDMAGVTTFAVTP